MNRAMTTAAVEHVGACDSLADELKSAQDDEIQIYAALNAAREAQTQSEKTTMALWGVFRKAEFRRGVLERQLAEEQTRAKPPGACV